MKVFITGSTGLLGSALLRLAPSVHKLYASYNINTLVPNVLCDYRHMDITDAVEVEKVIGKIKPDVVIHTAAIATPDYCDKHQKEATAVNVGGTKNILAACKKAGAKIIFITTNGVYDGKKAPYAEDAAANPIDWYGKTKVEGEMLTEKSGVTYMIARLITMYGWNNPRERQNPVTWQQVILGENKTPLNMVSDMYNNFLYSDEAARAIWAAIERGTWGEKFNIAGKNCVSRYDFSVHIARAFGHDTKMIYPVKMDYFKNFVPRPKNTCFVTKKMSQVLEVEPVSTSQGLKHMANHPLPINAWRAL